jgi:type IV pilus assembly protein PilC
VSGTLDESLRYISKDLRRDHEFHERIKSALLYPAFVLAVAFIVISGLVVFVIPRLTEITQSFGDDMPLSTQIVSRISLWLSDYGGLVLLAVIGSMISLVFALKKPSFKVKFDSYLLHVPLIGPLMRRYTVSRFLRILGGCIKNGVPLLQSFTIIERVLGHQEYREACQRLEHRIAKGNSLSIALTHEPTLFPASVISLVKGGEKTGTLSQALFRLSSFYEAEIDRDLKRLTDLIEPVLTVILGIIVAAIALAVIAPIYQLTSKIK